MAGRVDAAALISTLALCACTGIWSDGPTGDDSAPQCDADEPHPGPTPLRRLSHTEYENAIRDAFPSVELPPPSLVADQTLDGFENAAALLQVSELLVGQYESAAADTARTLAENIGAWSSCTEAGCAPQWIADVGQRLFRRPLTAEQQRAYEELFATELAAIDYEGAVELTLYAMLQSPEFLYRLETSSAGAPGDVVSLDGYEIAARLSFLIVGSSPDAELYARADELSSPEVREEEARRLLSDPRATDQIVDFHRQWLEFDRIEESEWSAKDPSLFPQWNDALVSSIAEEPGRFVRFVMENEATLPALLTLNRGPVNARLAELYGVAAPASGWEVRDLPAAERAGILTRANFLASHAHTTNGSPPLRGVMILRRVLCSPIPDPPMDADTSTPTVPEGEAPRTNRELFEERTSSPTCQSCHASIDPIGYGFEAYDAIGSFRTTDRGFPVDASGQLQSDDGAIAFDGAVELSAALADSADVQQCFTTQLFRFAHGRSAERDEACRVADLSRTFRENGGDIRELLVELVRRPEFASRTIPEDVEEDP